MKIHFERSGGFAAIRLAAEIDSESLPESEARALREEVRAANFFDLPSAIPTPAAGADRFQYRLTISDAGREHTVVVDEAGIPDSLRPLVEHLSLLARTHR